MFDFVSITLIIVLATLSPGPDFALVSRNALRYSQSTGLMTALGIMCGTLLHSLYCIFGLAMVISQSLILFSVIKYIGAIYLIYLGIRGLLEKETSMDEVTSSGLQYPSRAQAFQQGLFCTALNPKAILFFVAFFTIIIKPSMSFTTQSLYALEIAVIDILWFTAVSYFFSHQKIKNVLGQCLHYVSKVFGGFLVLFGLKVASLAVNST